MEKRWCFRTREWFADFKELCRWIMEHGNSPELFDVQVWHIWHQRNQLRLQQPCCNGEVIASLIQQLDQAFQPVEGEAIVACRAVEFGSELGVGCAIVEGDSEVIVKALRNKDNGLTSFALLINDDFQACFQNCRTLILGKMVTKLLIV